MTTPPNTPMTLKEDFTKKKCEEIIACRKACSEHYLECRHSAIDGVGAVMYLEGHSAGAAEMRERAAMAAARALPKAHTHSSENADIYHAQDHALGLACKAIRALPLDEATRPK